jgi:dolichol-phosphate mannosyltransferase
MALNEAARQAAPRRLSIVIPTRNEELNVGPLLEQLALAFDPADTELLVVDDSDDETPEALVESAADSALAVRLLHRPPGTRKGGLSSAVIAGARHARGAWVLVMDADLQHPPETAAALAKVAMRHDVDIVIGTRYAGGASSSGLSGAGRGLVSAWSSRLAKSLFPRRLATVSDPMSGLFAFRRDSVSLDQLKPVGFKILLEILVRTPRARVAEVAYCFAPRYAGRSKASFRQGLIYLRHLARLRRARLVSQLRQRPPTRAERVRQGIRFFAFGLVGLTGVVVNTAALWFFYRKLGWNHLVGASLATQLSTTWNFLLVDSLIYRKRAHGTRGGRAIRFFLMNNLLLLARLPVLQLLVVAGMDVLAANAVTLVMLFLVRFVVSDRAIFGSAAADKARDPVRILVDLTSIGSHDGPQDHAPSSRKRSRYLTYRYDIAGVVTIGSQIRLPELEFFRAQWVADDEVDIAVRVGDVGRRTPHKRASMTQYVEPTVIRYEEHFGRIGANFRIHLGQPISVEVGPLLAHSCHVVYTNIIEPLLRFVMVTRDRMLLHSACVEVNGVGVMLSALTDTGKTGTVLRLLREHGGRFLSDDMTVIDAHGNAWCFPKPLTISAHTLRAVSADDLTRPEWRKLQFQSRLHSKGGRSIALALARFNLPIMALNATTQILIPPPKYTVDRLIPCRMASATQVRELFIIERGQPRLADLDHGSALQQLITNTDDAYGFPPFRYLAPAITLNGQDYHHLREAEQDILASFLGHVRLRVLSSDTFGWADEIPGLIAQDGKPAFDVSDTRARHQTAMPDAWPQWQGGRPQRRRPLPAYVNGPAADSGNGHEPPGEGHIPGLGNGHAPDPGNGHVPGSADDTATAFLGGPAPPLGDDLALADADGIPARLPDPDMTPVDLAKEERAPTPSLSQSLSQSGPAGAVGPWRIDLMATRPPDADMAGTRPERAAGYADEPDERYPARPLPYSGPVHAPAWRIGVWLATAGILALAAFLRFWQLTAVGFNSDEAVYTGSAASLAGNSTLQPMFPVFRAHPLLFQTLLSLVLRVHDTDWTARAFAATIGVAAVALTLMLGRRLYGTGAGLLAGLLLAIMPYHAIVSRQVLLDGLMALCATAALYCVARYVENGRLSWLLGTASMMGAAILSKETSVVLVGGLYVFFALTPAARIRARHLVWASLLMVAEVAVWPITLRLAGHAHTGQSYLLWQLFRRANHETWFYFTVLPGWIGLALLAAAVAGLIWLRKEATWRERLLLSWVAVPLLFFTVWPVKGFEYLLPIAPPLAVLAGRTLAHPLPAWRESFQARLLTLPRWLRRVASGSHLQRSAMAVLAAAIVLTLIVPTWSRIEPSPSTSFLAGSGGLNGGRQVGEWVLHNAPAGARLLAIGPSAANVLEFYGHHPVSALSVSSNPHDRNPVYRPVTNPDLALRRGVFQYVVWDAYTAARTPFFAAEARRLVSKYHGVAVYTATIDVRASSGADVPDPVFIVYKVHP